MGIPLNVMRIENIRNIFRFIEQWIKGVRNFNQLIRGIFKNQHNLITSAQKAKEKIDSINIPSTLLCIERVKRQTCQKYNTYWKIKE